MSDDNRKMSPKPTATPPPPGEEGYRLEILFNPKAQLTRVNYPSDMTLARAVQHLAVALQFVAGEMER